MATFVVVGTIILGIIFPEVREFWPYIAPTVTAILGVGGVSLGVNEVRKAVESGGLAEIAQRFRKKEGGNNEP
jgi:hypothetical protein